MLYHLNFLQYQSSLFAHLKSYETALTDQMINLLVEIHKNTLISTIGTKLSIKLTYQMNIL